MIDSTLAQALVGAQKRNEHHHTRKANRMTSDKQSPCPSDLVQLVYSPVLELKYGCNPQQNPARVLSTHPDTKALPFTILNGTPGYINLLDALNAWQLVRELTHATQLPAAASFKHVSPAGAAVYVPLSPLLEQVYGVEGKTLTPLAVAYVRARNADPKSSFGDFIALSHTVDVETARFIKNQVSDGIIAPGYDKEALELLAQKKGNKYIVLQGDVDFEMPRQEFRSVHGCVLEQARNDILLDESHFSRVVTETAEKLPKDAVRDLLLASISLKYTQSNSVGYALDGQMIGIGAGQQSRIDCTRLAGSKADTWYLRQHPKVVGLPFREQVRQAVVKLNARIRYIEGDFTGHEYKEWLELFEYEPEPLGAEEKKAFLDTMSGVSLSSDAFFPFRDNIDQASRRGVRYVAQPGGSVQDEEIIRACHSYGMSMVFTGVRLFHH